MSLVIPDEFLQTAQISEAELKLEVAILLFQQEKITFNREKSPSIMTSG